MLNFLRDIMGILYGINTCFVSCKLALKAIISWHLFNFPMLSFMTPWFIGLVVCEEWKETWLCIWQDAILALWTLSQECAGFGIHLHSKEFLHQICKGFRQKNIQSQIFKLYIRQIEKSGRATSLNRYIRNKELRKRGNCEQVRNVRSHCHLQWKFQGLGNLACKSLNYHRKRRSF